jgi:hypothetical protein
MENPRRHRGAETENRMNTDGSSTEACEGSREGPPGGGPIALHR